ncbi:hypothetical protein Dip510_001097 [Elusimicrobium posterum]|uniref:peptidase MA family metallohydrolase n=1 Tax=Elusimicrobium posterum TaxID=3116653 RepID=UPI003C733BD3
MEIIKQLQILVILGVAVITVPPVLQHFGVPVKDIVKKVLIWEQEEETKLPQGELKMDAYDREDPVVATAPAAPAQPVVTEQASGSARPSLNPNGSAQPARSANPVTVTDMAKIPNHDTADTAAEKEAAQKAAPPPSTPASAQAAEKAKREAAEYQDISQRITGLENYARTAPVPGGAPQSALPPAHTPPGGRPVAGPSVPATAIEGGVSGMPALFDNKPFKEKIKWIAPPPGFYTQEAHNMLIYRESQSVTPRIKSVLERIHGNLMLDLLPFTLSMKKQKILVMLFGDKESYSSFTSRPPWSGASADLQRDTLYVVEGDSFYPLSIHEMTHLYFDGFFLPKQSPLWLSEGMAVYMQSNTAQGAPPWIESSLKEFKKGNVMPIEKFAEVKTLKNFQNWEAELWYSQAYSLVDYMLNVRSRNEFYQFCVNLKEGMPSHQALYHAYGLPFTKLEVLENVWLHDLQKGKLDKPKK